MNLRRLLTLGSLASAPTIVIAGTRFGRTVILSHLLSATEFGVGTAFSVMLGMAEVVTDIALERFLISRASGDDGEVLAAAHLLSLLRGLLLTGLLLLASPWIADFLGAPDEASGFRWASLVPLLRSLAHLELKQVQRDFRYAPDAIATILAFAGAFATAYGASLWFHDHRAMLAVLYVESGVYVLASHLLATRRFSLRVTHRDIMREALSYGLPLTLNGITLGVMSQLDRALVSHWFGLETLAFYALMFNLAVLPLSPLFDIINRLAMPFLVRESREAGAWLRAYLLIDWSCNAAAAAYAVAVAATLDTLAPVVFGPAYTVPPSIHGMLALLVWLRSIRNAPALALLCEGLTRQVVAAGLLGTLGVGAAALGLFFLPRLETVFAGLLFGDLLSAALLLRSIWPRLPPQTGYVLRQLTASFVPAAMAGLCVMLVPPQDLVGRATIIGAAALIVIGYFLFDARHHLRGRFSAQ